MVTNAAAQSAIITNSKTTRMKRRTELPTAVEVLRSYSRSKGTDMRIVSMEDETAKGVS